MDSIDLFSAIKEMRRLTELNEPFSFVHASFDRDLRKTSGIRVVHRATLRHQASEDDVKNANHKLFYYDHDIREPRVCWQPLIMYFNNKRITL